MSTLHHYLPSVLEIPVPIPDPRPRGIRSHGALSVSYTIRLDRIAMQKLDKQARALNVKRAEYIRWCAEKMADAIATYLFEHDLLDKINEEASERENTLLIRGHSNYDPRDKLVYPDSDDDANADHEAGDDAR